MKLSKNFSLSEFLASDTADRRGISNTPKREHLVALTALSTMIMQPIREYYNKGVIITSGYRSEQLNSAIGGSSTSQHSLGEATDFTVQGEDVYNTCKRIVEESGLDFDQIIYEVRGNTEWIHISYNRLGGNRKEVLTAVVQSDGKAEYTRGLNK
jgi:hypothetical protein